MALRITDTLSLFLILVAFIIYNIHLPTQITLNANQLDTSYDYVIIGGGTTGCVLAARLSEDPNKTVLLIEAGPEETEILYSHVPKLAGWLIDTKFDWKFYSEPQKYCCNGLENKRIYIPRGKVLGGTNILNTMLYVRGHPEDYDQWEQLGNPGWSWKDVQPYFIKLEGMEVDQYKKLQTHGQEGPVHISEAHAGTLGKLFMEAAKALGYFILNDTTGSQVGGFGLPLFSAHNGIRQSTVRTYLRPAMKRENLHVINNAHASRILFDTDDHKPLKASAVEYIWRDDQKFVVQGKEIILSAGAISSPQILMLSGIGPKKHLEKMGIKVLHDLQAVGSNLDDHLETFFIYGLNSSSPYNDSVHEPLDNFLALLKNVYLYCVHGRGTLTMPLVDSIGFFRKDTVLNKKRPDFQVQVLSGYPIQNAVKLQNKLKATVDQMGVPSESMKAITFAVVQLHPQSKGTIRLRSTDPNDHPAIDPNFCSEEQDVQVQAQALRLIMKFMESEPFKKYGPKPLENPMSGCQASDGIEFLSDKYLQCIARRRSVTGFHPISTCRMGNDSRTSVVDSKLKVHGVQGLRIVDASIFPDNVSGNINAPVIIVAEKAADIIKSDTM